MAHRYKGDDNAGTNGSSITTWTDSFGSSNAAQQGALAVPTVVTAGPNSHKAVAFSSQGLAFTETAGDNVDRTIVVVMKPTSTSPGGPGNFFGGNRSGPVGLCVGQDAFGSAGFIYMAQAGTYTIGESATAPTAAWHVIIAKLQGSAGASAAWSIRSDGTVIASGAANAGYINQNQTTSYLGANFTGSAWSDPYAGQIAEVLVYNSYLSASDEAKVDSYVQDTYAVTVSDYVAAGAATPGAFNFTQAAVSRAANW
jgi:hypothetical protein